MIFKIHWNVRLTWNFFKPLFLAVGMCLCRHMKTLYKKSHVTHTINIINSNLWHILVSLQLIIMIHKYFWVVFNKCIVAHFSVEFLHRLSCILSLLVPSLLTWNFLSCEPYKLSLVSFSTFCIKPSYLVATWCID